MASHNHLGQTGESIARRYFQDRGYRVLFVNWRYSYFEIDLICEKAGILHIVEVKTRSHGRYGFPEEDVTPKKFRRLLAAAEEFLYQHPRYRHVQYDILSIIMQNARPELFLIEDVML